MSGAIEAKEEVKLKYGSAARAVAESGSVQACCDPGLRCCDPITSNLYSAGEKGLIPEKAVLASLGCGNPTALIELKAGETVLDLGSGGGIDVLLSARRVGPAGKAYGLDMTDEMLALAREKQRQAGVENVEFLKGETENIPLPDNSVDVVMPAELLLAGGRNCATGTEGLRSKSWDEFAAPGAPRMDFVFTVCDNAANEVCPYWPGQPMTAHWGIPDPAAVKGSAEEIARAFREAFVVLDRRIGLFLSLPLTTLQQLAVQKELERIGRS